MKTSFLKCFEKDVETVGLCDEKLMKLYDKGVVGRMKPLPCVF